MVKYEYKFIWRKVSMNFQLFYQNNEVFLWIFGLVFLFFMISGDKKEFKKIIMFLIVGVVFLLLYLKLSQYKEFAYIGKCLMITCASLLLLNDILTFKLYLSNGIYKNEKKSIKLSLYKTYSYIISIFNIFFIQIANIGQYIELFILVIMLVDLCIIWIIDSHITIYKNGILLDNNSLFKRFFIRKKIIPYDEFEFNFLEYEKGKFNMNIKLKHVDKNYEFQITEEEKSLIESCIKDFA